MPTQSSSPYPFGDVLALARQSWLAEMARRLDALGYTGYRRSDAGALRMLWRGPLSVGELGARLGVTRQAARKVADNLEQRGYATAKRDARDSRQVNITLTTAGYEYATTIATVIAQMNLDLAGRVNTAQLAAADEVLRAAMFDESTRQRANWLRRPGS